MSTGGLTAVLVCRSSMIVMSVLRFTYIPTDILANKAMSYKFAQVMVIPTTIVRNC